MAADNHNLMASTGKLGRFALPIIGMALLNMAANFVGMLLVARYGKVELAAGSLGVATFITIMTVSSTTLYSVGILVGHSRGQKHSNDQVGTWVKNGFWVALGLGIPCALLIYHGDTILQLFGQSQVLIDRARGYLHYAALSLIPTLFGLVISQFFIGIGRPQITLIASAVRLPLIIILFYPLILGYGGGEPMKLAGISAATLVVQILYCIIMLLYIHYSPSMRGFGIFKAPFAPSWEHCKKLLVIGLPIGIQFGGELGAMTVSTYMMGLFGVTALAATQIVSQYTMLAVMITLGLSQAISVVISEAYGAGDYPLIRNYIKAGFILLLSFFAIVIALFLYEPHLFIGIYIDVHQPGNAAVVSLAVLLFAVAAVAMLIDGMRNLLSGALRGLHDSKAPMWIGVFCLWGFSLPMAYLVAFRLHEGPVGLRIGFALGFVIATLLLVVRCWHRLSGSGSSSKPMISEITS
ncbi:MATE family efflux transporter [Dongshaea marina]|uniref:MATE family efflux transporter n=1 Tax=Dongshaea marina TaxID=2047966 RepID=UPI000D3E608D|nr:MATE family efflux transporter [Dongshaea marina]